METAKIVPFGPVVPPSQPCAVCEWRIRAAIWFLEILIEREEVPEKRDLLNYAVGLLAQVGP